MQSMLTGYEKLRDDAASAIADAKAVGASYLGTAWIPHQGAFTREHVDQAVADFTKWGKALKAEGLQFHYHVHGYEFQPSADGTLLDTLDQEHAARGRVPDGRLLGDARRWQSGEAADEVPGSLPADAPEGHRDRARRSAIRPAVRQTKPACRSARAR